MKTEKLFQLSAVMITIVLIVGCLYLMTPEVQSNDLFLELYRYTVAH